MIHKFKNRKIRNKERWAYRGKKQRYAVFRAELNRRWEIIEELFVRQTCLDNGLELEDHMVHDKRLPWEATMYYLRKKGYRPLTKSYQMLQAEGEEKYARQKQRAELVAIYGYTVPCNRVQYESTERASLA